MANENVSRDPRAVADRLHSTAIHLLRRVRKVDEASGLSPARLSALSVLVFGGPTSLGDLARAEQVSPPTMSRLVAGLERDGLVVRKPDERDARAVRVRSTPKGRRILRRGRERRVSTLVELLGGTSPEQLATLGSAADILESLLALPSSASTAYPAGTAERRWSGLSDDSTGSGGTRR